MSLGVYVSMAWSATPCDAVGLSTNIGMTYRGQRHRDKASRGKPIAQEAQVRINVGTKYGQTGTDTQKTLQNNTPA